MVGTRTRTLAAFTAVLLLAPLAALHAADARKPNVIFVLADDLGSGDLGCYGGEIAPTPNLDRLAREGIRFTQYYSAAPICSPSRCGLVTGQFPGRWRITSYLQTRAGNRQCEQADFLDPAAPSLPRALKAAGYATAHVGKWHLGGGRDVTGAPKFAAYGYDEAVGTYESPEPYPDITATDWIWSDKDKVKRWNRTAFFVDKTLDFLARHPAQPCFVNLWIDDPHTPWVPEGADSLSKGDTRKRLARVVAEIDLQIGRLMDGVPANTLLVFASDNGALPTFQGARTLGLRGSKLSLYEGGIRLPFIARWPGRVPAGRVDESTVLAAVDMLPTLCAVADAKPPEGTDGEDLSAALLGQATARTRPLFWEYGRNDKSFGYPAGRNRSPNVAIRDGKWKLLINADGSGAELYDLAADAKESKNLATEEPALVKRLADAALAWRRSLPTLPQASQKQ
ncbi:MAG: sulfatase family protein [Pirellulales bacterium]